MSGDPATQEWRQALAGTAVTNSWDTASASVALQKTQADLAASQQDLTSMEQQRNEARKLLEYALHLRMHGERAPGGNETWREFDRRCEAYLRGLPPSRPCAWQGLAEDLMREREQERSTDG